MSAYRPNLYSENALILKVAILRFFGLKTFKFYFFLHKSLIHISPNLYNNN